MSELDQAPGAVEPEEPQQPEKTERQRRVEAFRRVEQNDDTRRRDRVSAFRQSLVDDQKSLQRIVEHRPDTSPEQDARILKIVEDKGWPEEIVRGNFETIDKLARAEELDPLNVAKTAPRLSSWLRENNGANFGAAADDIETLSTFERYAGLMVGGLGRGGAQQKVGLARFARLHENLEGKPTGLMGEVRSAILDQVGVMDEEEIRYLEENVLNQYLGEETIPEIAWTEFWTMLPFMTNASAAGMAVAIPVGVAGQAGPQVATPEEFVTIPAAMATGALIYGSMVETGLADSQFRGMTDEDGNPLDDDVRVIAASSYGAVAGALERLGMGGLMKMLPGPARKLVLRTAARATAETLRKRSMREAVKRYVKDAGSGHVGEVATEVGQEIWQSVMAGAAQRVQGGKWEEKTIGQHVAELTDVAIRTSLGIVPLQTMGGAPRLHYDVRQARRTRADAARLEMLAETSRGSKLRERSPEAFKAAAKRMLGDTGPATHAYIKVGEWDRVMEKRGAEPATIAAEVMGSEDAYVEARKAGPETDLVIPMEDYLTHLVDAEVHDDLSQVTRLNQGAMSVSEMKADLADRADMIKEGLKRDVEDYSPAEHTIYREEYRKVLRVRGNQAEADANAKIRTHMTKTLAERAGVDPLTLYRRDEVRMDRADKHGHVIERAQSQAVSELQQPSTRASRLEREAAVADARSTLEVARTKLETARKEGDEAAVEAARQEVGAARDELDVALRPQFDIPDRPVEYTDENTRRDPASMRDDARLDEVFDEVRELQESRAITADLLGDGERAGKLMGASMRELLLEMPQQRRRVEELLGKDLDEIWAPEEDEPVRLNQSAARAETAKILQPVIENLTPEEAELMQRKTAQKLVDLFNDLPSSEELAAIAFEGRGKRGWYAKSAETIAAVFGPDAVRFAQLLAAMSPKTSVENNLANALSVWINWVEAGRPTDKKSIREIMGRSVQGQGGKDSVLLAWVNNTVGVLSAEDPSTFVLSGPKVDSFWRNLTNDVMSVTNDAWIANFNLFIQDLMGGAKNVAGTNPGKGAAYLAVTAQTREAARILTERTGELWTPAEVQETVWSWTVATYEMSKATKRPATEVARGEGVIFEGDDTVNELESRISDVPDFSSLFMQDEYRTILERTEYGREQLSGLARDEGDAAADQADDSRAAIQAAPFDEATQRRHVESAARRLDELQRIRAGSAQLRADTKAFAAANKLVKSMKKGQRGIVAARAELERLRDALAKGQRSLEAAYDKGRFVTSMQTLVEEIDLTEADGVDWLEAASKSTREGYLSEFTLRELEDRVREKGTKFFVSADETIGYYMDADGYTGGLFNNGGPRGGGQAAFVHAMVNGAQSADCFAPYLPKLYGRYGWTITDVIPWDDQYRPKSWRDKDGKPDVVFIEYNGTRDLEQILRGYDGEVTYDPEGQQIVERDGSVRARAGQTEGDGRAGSGEAAQAGVQSEPAGSAAGVPGQPVVLNQSGIAEPLTPPNSRWESTGNTGMNEPLLTVDDGFAAIELVQDGRNEAATKWVVDSGEFGHSEGAFDTLEEAVIHAETLSGRGGPVPGVPGKVRLNQSLAQTLTDAFRRWFRESKVVDEAGEPKVVWHGRAGGKPITEFKPTKSGRSGFMGATREVLSPVSFFSESPYMAWSFGQNRADFPGDAGVQKVYLSIQNPIDLTGKDVYRLIKKYGLRDSYGELVTKDNAWEAFDVPANIEKLRHAGFDGALISERVSAKAFGHLKEPGAKNTWVAFDPEQIKSATDNVGTFDPDSPNILNQDEDDPRGQIEFIPGTHKYNMKLFEGADPTTLFHESAHFYLELLGDVAAMESASDQVRDDYKATLKWLGVKKRSEIGVAQQERWAKGFEEYLRRGKAPSLALAGTFARARAWMLMVYGRARELVKLSPEIEGVFDRMLASDDEIEAARADQFLSPIPEIEAGMTEAELARYQDTARRAAQEGQEALQGRLMADVNRELEEWYKAERDNLRPEVEEQLARRPVMRALSYLQRGRIPGVDELPDSLKDAQGGPVKLSKDKLVERYGDAARRSLYALGQPWVYTRKQTGVDPEDVAPIFGFGSGQEMVEALGQLDVGTNFEAAVEAELDNRMKQKYGSLIEAPSEMAAEAVDAALNPQQVEQALIEIRYLARMLRDDPKAAKYRPVNRDQLKRQAEETYVGAVVSTIRPHVHQRAAAKHGSEAFEAARKGDLGAAYDAKVLQLWNQMLYRAARDAKLRAEVTVRKMRRAGTPSARARRGKAGADYQEQVDALLEQYEFRPESRKATERRQSLREWVSERQSAQQKGTEQGQVVIDQRLLERAEKRHYNELPLDELEAVGNAVENIDQLVRLKTTLISNKNRRDREAMIDDAISSAELHMKDRGLMHPDPYNQRAMERVAAFLRKGDSWLLRIEEVIRRLDGDDPDGPWARMIWNPIVDAQSREGDLTADLVIKLAETFDRLPRARRNRLFDETVHIKTLDDSLTRQATLVVALNWGSESNRARMLHERAKPAGFKRWDEEVIAEILGTLDKEDWAFVQSVWDTMESMWPQIAAMEKRLTGVEPPKVDRAPVSMTIDGEEITMPGGYYPLVYDRRQSSVGIKQADASEDVSVLFDHRMARAMTPHGHVMERVDSFGAPILLDINVITRHLQQVAHDLSHREAVMSVYGVLTDDRIIQTLQRYLGPEQADQFIPWIKRIAGDRTGLGDPAMEKFLGRARMNATVAAMGFKATVSLQNLANFSNVLEKVGAKHLARATRDVYRHPRQQSELVHALSGEMRHRFNNLERDIRQATQKLAGKRGGSKTLTAVQHMAFRTIQYTDAMTAYPAWLAAFREAQTDGIKLSDGTRRVLNKEQAIRHADRVVRITLSAGASKDIAAVQAGGEAMKWFTMFYSWFGTAYMRFRALGYDVKRSADDGRIHKDLPGFMARMLAFWVVPATVAELLANRGPDEDDDEGWLEWAATKTLLYPAMTIPFMRDLAGWIESALGGNRRSVQFGPMARAIEETGRLTMNAYGYYEGDKEFEDLFKSAFRVSGYAVGLPTSQAEITGGYLWDLMAGEAEPESVVEFARDLTYRRPPERKR